MRILFYCVAALAAATSAPLGAQVWSVGNARDPQLQELVAEAVRNSPEIRAASNERLASQHRVSPAGALDDPMLEAGVLNAPWSGLRLNREDMTMKMLGLSQKFPFPGKRDLRQGVAEKDAESVAHAYQETVNRVVRDVKTAYFELAFATESARLVEKNRQVLEQFLKISESRYSVGQGDPGRRAQGADTAVEDDRGADKAGARTQRDRSGTRARPRPRARKRRARAGSAATARGAAAIGSVAGNGAQGTPADPRPAKPDRPRRQGAGAGSQGLLPGPRRQVLRTGSATRHRMECPATIW